MFTLLIDVVFTLTQASVAKATCGTFYGLASVTRHVEAAYRVHWVDKMLAPGSP